MRPVVGVVYNPFTNTLYSGIDGQGSFLTDQFHDRARLPLTDPEPFAGLDKTLVAVEWGSDRSGNDYDVKVKTFRKLCASKDDGGAMVHSLRSFGSAALNMCAVATGHIDIYWEAGCWAWDVCAGWVIVKEAGGEIVDANQGNWKPRVDGRRYVFPKLRFYRFVLKHLHRYMAVRKGEGQKDIIEEFWNNVEGTLEVTV